MAVYEIIRFCFRSLHGYPLRTGLMLLAMAIGVGLKGEMPVISLREMMDSSDTHQVTIT